MKNNHLKLILRSCTHRLFAITLLMFIAFSVDARTIHWITFINTDDPHVGSMDQNARKTLYGSLIDVVNYEASQYKYDYQIQDYYSGSFNPVECKTCLDNLKCDTTDIIVFYFIGHGARMAKDNSHSKYPHLLFDDRYENSIPLSWIHQTLKNKGARLTMTFAVCDNSYLGVDGKPIIEDVSLPIVKRIHNDSSLEEHDNSSLAKIFLGYKGDMIVCSASPGQHTWGMQTDLGPMDLFTYLLASYFGNINPDNVMMWPDILESISSQITDTTKSSFSSVQTPAYDYSLDQIQMPKRDNTDDAR